MRRIDFLIDALWCSSFLTPTAADISSTMSATRSRDEHEDIDAPSPKRTKLDETEQSSEDVVMTDAPSATDAAAPSKEVESLLPPSHALLGAPSPVYTPDGSMQKIMETDVGISEYVGHDIPRIQGIIKQRYAPPLCPSVAKLRSPQGSQTSWLTKLILTATWYTLKAWTSRSHLPRKLVNRLLPLAERPRPPKMLQLTPRKRKRNHR